MHKVCVKIQFFVCVNLIDPCPMATRWILWLFWPKITTKIRVWHCLPIWRLTPVSSNSAYPRFSSGPECWVGWRTSGIKNWTVWSLSCSPTAAAFCARNRRRRSGSRTRPFAAFRRMFAFRSRLGSGSGGSCTPSCCPLSVSRIRRLCSSSARRNLTSSGERMSDLSLRRITFKSWISSSRIRCVFFSLFALSSKSVILVLMEWERKERHGY